MKFFSSNFLFLVSYRVEGKFLPAIIDGECLMTQKHPNKGTIYCIVDRMTIPLDMILCRLFVTSWETVMKTILGKLKATRTCGKIACIWPPHLKFLSRQANLLNAHLPQITLCQDKTLKDVDQALMTLCPGQNYRLVAHFVKKINFFLTKTLNFQFQECMEIEMNIEQNGEKDRILGGLKSYGFNCYQNVVIQLLFSIDPLREFFNTLVVPSSAPLSASIKRIFKSMSINSITASRDMLKAIGWPERHHDASELFDKILCQLASEKEVGDALSDLIQNLFGVMMCDFSENLGLVVSGLKGDLESELKQFSAIRLPPILVVSLGKVVETGKGAGTDRSSEEFRYPFHFDAGYAMKTESQLYALKFVVFHAGSGVGGHYISALRKNDTWTCFDDSKVAEIDEKVLMSCAPFKMNGTSNFSASLLVYEAI